MRRSQAVAKRPGSLRLLVCGSRTWVDARRIGVEVATLAPSVLIHGAAAGADTLAAAEAVRWALAFDRSFGVESFPADWQRDGKGAGPIRNARMLAEGKPTRGLAFGSLWKEDPRRTGGSYPGWRLTGTGDMVRRMVAACLPVRWVRAPGQPAVDLLSMPRPWP